MKIDDLVMLIKAGYTKADIESLGIAMGAEPETEPAPAVAEPVPEEPEAPKDDRITNLETKLDYVINRFNYLAVKDSQQPAANPTQSVDDILASVVRGTEKPKRSDLNGK